MLTTTCAFQPSQEPLGAADFNLCLFGFVVFLEIWGNACPRTGGVTGSCGVTPEHLLRDSSKPSAQEEGYFIYLFFFGSHLLCPVSRTGDTQPGAESHQFALPACEDSGAGGTWCLLPLY